MDRRIKVALIFLVVCVACCCKYGYANAMRSVKAADSGNTPAVAEGVPGAGPIPEIAGYCVRYGEADGRNGYYRSVPQIELLHQDAGFETHYCLVYPDGREEEGVLREKGSCIKWETLDGDGLWKLRTELVLCANQEEANGDDQNTGENTETGVEGPSDGGAGEEREEAWEEFEKNLAEWKKEYEWQVDGTVPVLQVISPQNRNAWYQSAVTVQLCASDTGSGIQKFQVETGGQSYVSKNKRDLLFQVNEESKNAGAVSMLIEITDYAGNVVQSTMELYIDRTGPEVEIGGIDPYQISGENRKLILSGKDNNGIGSLEGRIEYMTPEGEKRQSKVERWAQTSHGRVAELSLEQEGTYRIEITAVDVAGHRCTEEKQLTIDKTPPVIHLPEGLDQSVRQEFCLKEELGSLVTDFTTVSGRAELDGRLFYSGEAVKKEGKHTFLFRAVDAAGNQSEARAEFRIDRTAPVIQILEADTKQAADDGKVYEEAIWLSVTTQEPEDRVRTVRVNGKRLKRQGDEPGFLVALEEEGVYEIQAEACDFAGNVSERTLDVQVKAPESVIEKAAVPARKLFQKIMDSTGREAGKEQEAEEEQAGASRGWMIVFCIVIVGGIAFVINLVKREDAG